MHIDLQCTRSLKLHDLRNSGLRQNAVSKLEVRKKFLKYSGEKYCHVNAIGTTSVPI